MSIGKLAALKPYQLMLLLLLLMPSPVLLTPVICQLVIHLP
jgi:hypothetical protein